VPRELLQMREVGHTDPEWGCDMPKGRRTLTRVGWFFCGIVLCTTAVALAEQPRTCTGVGNKCFTDFCNSPCDGEECCETKELTWSFCQHAPKGVCTEVNVYCGDRDYWTGTCSGGKCPHTTYRGFLRLKTSGCKGDPAN
jgi:hypothetical protein